MRGAPVPPEEYTEPGQEVLTDEVLRRDGWAAGLDAWEQVGKAYEWYLGQGHGDHPDGLDNAQMWSLQEAIKAHPRHDDPVAAWLERKRDEWAVPDPSREDHPNQWYAVDSLLSDYRERAALGVSLSEEVPQ